MADSEWFFQEQWCRVKLQRLLVVAALLLGGAGACVSMPENQALLSQDSELPAHWSTETSQGVASTGLLLLFDNNALENLVNQALENNFNLQETARRLVEARLLVKQTAAERLPEVTLNQESSRSRVGAPEKIVSTQYQWSMNARWELDVWGRLADSEASASYEYQAQASDYQAARDSLAAQVINLWLSLIAQQNVIRVQQDRIRAFQANEDLIRERFRAGVGDVNDLDVARLATANGQITLNELQEVFTTQQRVLRVLLGEYPYPGFQLPEHMPEIQALQAGVPADLVGNRPDLIAAYARIVSADYLTSVAYKALLPDFTLNASLGSERDSLRDLLNGTTAWSLLGQLTQPVFNAGRLEAQAESAESAAQRSYLAFRQTLLIALLEVENSLAQEVDLAQREYWSQQSLQHADTSLDNFQSRYRAGLVDFLDLLLVQQTRYAAQIQLIEVRQARLVNRINLGVALGAGV